MAVAVDVAAVDVVEVDVAAAAVASAFVAYAIHNNYCQLENYCSSHKVNYFWSSVLRYIYHGSSGDKYFQQVTRLHTF